MRSSWRRYASPTLSAMADQLSLPAPRFAGNRGTGRVAQALVEIAIERLIFFRIPVAAVAVLARLVEVLARVPQLFGISLLHDVEHFDADVAQRLDARVPLDGILADLRDDLLR